MAGESVAGVVAPAVVPAAPDGPPAGNRPEAVPVAPAGAWPARPDHVLPRPRLSERLSKGAMGRLTVVTGPPGSGKSTAVMSWAVSGGGPGPVAWLGCDPAEPPDRFWRRAGEALIRAGAVRRGAEPERLDAVSVVGLLTGPDAPPRVPVVLVLDDLCLTPGSPLAEDMAYLVRNAPAELRLVLVGRQDPPLPLQRYRLSGELTEIRAGELAMDEREIRLILAQHGFRPSQRTVGLLRDRTEGWAAGVRMAAMSLQERGDAETAASGFTGADEAVVEYVREEVLDGRPDEVRRLMLILSLTERMNAELAVELAAEPAPGRAAGRADTGDDPGAAAAAGGTAAIFAEIVRRNAFVLPAGDGWYRYHRMFGEALGVLLRREHPAQVHGLHRRAASWFCRIGRGDEAVRHAAATGDWPYAAQMVVDELAIGGVLGLTGSPPAGLLRTMPRSAVFGPEPAPAIVAAAGAAAAGDDELCAATLAHAENLLKDLPAGERVPERFAVALIRLVRRARPGSYDPVGAEAALSAAEQAVRRSPGVVADRPELTAVLAFARGAAALWEGRLQDAARSFDEAAVAAQIGGGQDQRRAYTGYLALTEALLGRFARAADLLDRAPQRQDGAASPVARPPDRPADRPAARAGARSGERSGARTGGAAWPQDAATHLARAHVALERYRIPEARKELAAVRSAGYAGADPLLAALRTLLTAWTDIADGLPGRSLETLRGAVGPGGTPAPPWLTRRMTLAESAALSALGRTGDAMAAAERAGGGSAPDSAVALVRARIQGSGEMAAMGALSPVRVESADVPSDVRVEAWLLDARIAYRTGEASRGRRSLDRALRLGDRERIRLPFEAAADWLRPVLLHDPELLQPYLRLLEPLLAEAGPPRMDPPASRPAAETLSPRELEVLRHLDRMMTNEEIAAQMCLSVNTVKTHLKSIYRKLSVTRRGGAVRRARQLSWL